MLPMLAQLGIALAGAQLQNMQAQDEYKRAKQKHFSDIQTAIMNRRAQRAGDAGYMQAAIGAQADAPRRPKSNFGPMLAQVGSALLSQAPEPDFGSSNDFTTRPGPQSGVSLRRSDFY